MPLSQYPASSRATLKVLVVLCILGFLANGTMIAVAQQAHRAVQQDNTRETIQNTERLDAVTRRVDDIQKEKLADRVTRLETIAETNHALLLTVTGGIAVLMLETALRLIASLSPLKKKLGQ